MLRFKEGFIRFMVLSSILNISNLFSQDRKIQTNWEQDQWLSRKSTLVLRVNPSLKTSEGNLAVFIGVTDMTDLFKMEGDSLVYRPSSILLPAGENQLIVYRVDPDGNWSEIAQIPLRILTKTGFERANVEPQVTINNKGQIAEGHYPASNAPERSSYQDFTGQINVVTEHAVQDLNLRSQWSLVGVSNQNEALRFGEKGEKAPKIDLSSYLIQMDQGPVSISAGHISHGRHRYLINFYSSRGTQLSLKLGSRLDFSFAAMNGTNIAGWDNFLGLANKNHRVYGGTLGLEIIKNRPGLLRLEASVMDGSLLPLNNFNQANITDAEKSQGFAFHLQASDPTQRVRLESGWARSSYRNPEDELLSQGVELVPVQKTTKNARYASLDVAVLQNIKVSQNWMYNLSINLRHERVDPLYRSLGAFARADFLENGVSVQSSLGLIGWQYAHTRSEDNLDNIRSILKTKTRIHTFNLSLPLKSILGGPTGGAFLLPSMSYNYNRTHQFGAFLPENGGFSESHVPNQMSNSHSGSLDWQGNRWQFAYRVSYSLQDNRQPGRENADFKNLNHTFSWGLTPFRPLDVSFDLSFESFENKEADRTDLTRRYGFSVNLKTTRTSTFNASYSNTHFEDDALTTERNNSFINIQWSIGFRVMRSLERQWVNGQFFVRYSRNASDQTDNIFGFNDKNNNWSINTGFNLGLF